MNDETEIGAPVHRPSGTYIDAVCGLLTGDHQRQLTDVEARLARETNPAEIARLNHLSSTLRTAIKSVRV